MFDKIESFFNYEEEKVTIIYLHSNGEVLFSLYATYNKILGCYQVESKYKNSDLYYELICGKYIFTNNMFDAFKVLFEIGFTYFRRKYSL